MENKSIYFFTFANDHSLKSNRGRFTIMIDFSHTYPWKYEIDLIPGRRTTETNAILMFSKLEDY